MCGWKKQSGMTLVEVISAGAILLLVSLMAAKGFRTAGSMMERGRRIQAGGEAAEALAAEGESSISSAESELLVGDGSLSVMIEEYGDGDHSDVTVKIIRPDTEGKKLEKEGEWE